MERTRILFLLSRFLDGGIDSVMVEYLRCLSNLPQYEITLAVGMNYQKLEVYRHRIPSNVSVVHLITSSCLVKWRKRKISTPLPIYIKVFDEVLLNPVRRAIMSRKISQLASQADVVVDFDSCSHSFLKNISKPKVGFFHFSIKQVLQGKTRRIRRMERTIACYDKFITISKAMHQEALEMFPGMQSRFEMIYNGINLDGLRSMATAKVEDKRICEPYILSVTRLEESQKDVTTLLQSYAILRSKYKHSEQLVIIGKGKSESQLRHLAMQLGVANDVHFLGFCANPYPWISCCKLYVQSSKFEGLPTTLIETLLLDKPIVATDCPTGPREILDEGRAGILTPVGDAETMALAMHEVLTNKEVQHILSVGRNEHMELFRIERSAEKLCKLIAGMR